MSSSYVIINGVGYATPKAVDLNVFPHSQVVGFMRHSSQYFRDSAGTGFFLHFLHFLNF